MAAQRNKAVGNDLHNEGVPAVSESPTVVPVTLNSVTVDGIVEVTLSTTIKVNLGNYESKDIFGSAKARFHEGKSPEEAGEFLLDFIYGAANDELVGAKELAPKGSAVHKIVTN